MPVLPGMTDEELQQLGLDEETMGAVKQQPLYQIDFGAPVTPAAGPMEFAPPPGPQRLFPEEPVRPVVPGQRQPLPEGGVSLDVSRVPPPSEIARQFPAGPQEAPAVPDVAGVRGVERPAGQPPGMRPGAPAGVGGFGLGDLSRKAEKQYQSYVAKATEADKLAAGALEAKSEAVEEQRKLAGEYAQQRRDEQYWAEIDLEEKQAANQVKNEALRAGVQKQTGKIKQLSADLREKKVDPNRIFNTPEGETDYGKTTLAALAMAFGELGRAFMGGGPNMAMNLINNQIDRDIRAQETDIEQARGAVDAESNILQMMRQEMGDEQSAQLAARQMYLEQYDMKLDSLQSEYMSQDAAAKHQAMKAGLTQEKASNAMALEQRLLEAGQQNLAFQQASRVAGAQMAAARAQQQAARAQAQPGLGAVTVDPNRAMTQKQVEKGQEITSNAGPALGAMSELLALRRDHNIAEIKGNPEVFAKMEVLANRVMLGEAVLNNLGAISESDKEFVEKLAGGDPTGLGFVEDRMRAGLNTGISATNARLRPYNQRLDPDLFGER